jgi:hypothetical protein
VDGNHWWQFRRRRGFLDELIADEAWLEEDNERMRDLEVRFKGNKPATSLY